MPRRRHRDWGRGWVEVRQRRDGARYVARWLEEGRQRSRSFTTRDEAEDHLTAMQRGRARDAVPVSGATVDAAVALWLGANRYRWTESTRYTYERVCRDYLRPEFGTVPLDTLTPDMLRRWVDGLRLRRSDTTVRFVGGILAAVLNLAVREGLVARTPIRRGWLPPRRTVPVRVWTRSHMRSVLGAVRHDAWWHALYAVLLSTGMRRGELLALRWDDVDLGRGVVHVQRTVTPDRTGRPVVGETTKGKRNRKVPLTPAAVTALSGLPRRGELVFCRVDGQVYNGATLAYQHKAWCKQAKVPVITLHDLRHSVATLLLEENVNAKVVSEILGHADTATTLEIYQHVTDELARTAVHHLDLGD